MIKRIIKFPALSLRTPCKVVSFPLTPALTEHIQALRDTLAATSNGVALASNQVIAEGHRVFVSRSGLRVPAVKSMSPESKDGTMSFPEVVINPTREKIYALHEIDTDHPHDVFEHLHFTEGCLSIPELHISCGRQYWVEMEYQDETGERFVYAARALGARIIQHECDHLDGELLYDYADRKTQIRVHAEAIRNRKRGK